MGLVETHYPDTQYGDRITTVAPFEISDTLNVDEQGNLSLRTLRNATAEWAYTDSGKYCWLTIANDKKGDSAFVKVGSSYYWVEARSNYELYIILDIDSNTRNYDNDTYNFYVDSRYSTVYIPAAYIASYITTTTYICSSDPNAYPDQGNTDSSGAKYWKVGQPWEFLPKLGKVETGYYTGTGDGNVTLTFENAPQFLCVGAKNGGRDARMDWWIKDSDRAFESPRDSYIPVTISGNSLLLSSSYLNRNGVAYQYFAITQ